MVTFGESLRDPRIALLATIFFRGIAMRRTFATAMSVAMLAIFFASYFSSVKSAPQSHPETLAVIPTEDPTDTNISAESIVTDLCFETPFAELQISEAQVLDLFLDCPLPEEPEVFICGGCQIRSDYLVDPKLKSVPKNSPQTLLLKNGRLTVPAELLRGMPPADLQFGSAWDHNDTEDRLAAFLQLGSPVLKLDAAQALWQGHSRYYAALVLNSLPKLAEVDDEFSVQVEDDLDPQHLAREIRDGDCAWGAWLAGLRPHRDLVPLLLECLKSKPEHRAAIIIALGKSDDERAFGPLLQVLISGANMDAGFAAQALGHLGRPEAEAFLLQALYRHDSWLEMNACRALGMVGTSNALERLQELTDPMRYTGALNVRRCAQRAIEQIEPAKNRKPSGKPLVLHILARARTMGSGLPNPSPHALPV